MDQESNSELGPRLNFALQKVSTINALKFTPNYIDNLINDCRYETEDGQMREEKGRQGESGGAVITGGWEYIGSDGKLYKVF